MCGIAGIINLNGEAVSFLNLKKMTDAIIHRGPDGEGHWIEKNIGIGHRRLAIIDLSPAGHQPMVSLDNRYVITFNGEIYNFREIKKELQTYGYKFTSKTDSEVVLNALAYWGKDAFLKFNGMFALALWDKKEQVLILARDRYGIKPLYYSFQNNSFAFGSEQKAITAQRGFHRNLNKRALLEYFTFQNIFTDQTLIEGIHLLPAGNFAILNVNQKQNSKLQLAQYWDYHFIESTKLASKEEYTEELIRLFEQAVKRQMISDVEVGAYLSGGIDSGSITSIAAKQISNLKTFTCGFDLSSASGVELSFDERVKAQAMSALFKTEHHEIELKSGDMERCMKTLSYHLEEPRVGQSYPNYYSAKLASKFVKVVLSGSGGDELFGGYPWRYYRAANMQNFEEYIDNYYLYWQRLVDNKDLKKMFAPIWDDVKDVWTRDIFRDVFSNHKNKLECPEDFINHSLYFEAKTFLQGLFIVEDKLSMAHGLENRVPFMDNDLVDFAMKCPIKFKLNNLEKVLRLNENEFFNKQDMYFKKTNDGKQILRDAMRNFIPKEIIVAEKQGFSSPDSSWFKGESINFVKEKIFSNQSKILNYLDKKTLQTLTDQHFAGTQNKRLLIWSLISFEYYLNNI
jgi:asparagine synthase (glutamine-hydrolysing)